ncbi:CAPN3 [Symbiodinium sp. CCMP2592]|nr:CAPN3 [Symbiodinium sp. CCMP2592]
MSLLQRAAAGFFRQNHWPIKSSARSYLVDCSKVYVKADSFGGAGSYAAIPIRKGELVERGIVRRLPVDGNHCPYVFTWSEDKTVWASGSGCSVFYNASLDGNESTEMKRFFDEDRFEIYALRDLQPHEELTHLYKSMEWRACFQDLRQPANSSEATVGALEPGEENLVDCSKVEVRPDEHGGAGVFAVVPIKCGELVERGIVRRLPVDGNVSPYVFTWSEDKTVWASGSGCSVFYNASLSGSENTEVVRHFDQDRFEIIALRDIEQGEELTHLYKSIEWRSCFRDLKAQRDRK